jgi:hypothetical protein
MVDGGWWMVDGGWWTGSWQVAAREQGAVTGRCKVQGLRYHLGDTRSITIIPITLCCINTVILFQLVPIQPTPRMHASTCLYAADTAQHTRRHLCIHPTQSITTRRKWYQLRNR